MRDMNDFEGHRPDERNPAAYRDRLLARLGDRVTDVTLSPGQTLFEQGSPADAIYVLQDGTLDITALAEDGRKLVLNVLTTGAVFGEIAMFESGTRSASVSARTRSHVTRIGRDDLLAQIRSDPEFAIDMIRLSISRLAWVSEQLEIQTFQPLSVRLARRVVWLLSSIGDGLVLPVSQSELADHVGATREAVSKVLGDWKRQGIVELGRGKVTVCDPDALRAAALIEFS